MTEPQRGTGHVVTPLGDDVVLRRRRGDDEGLAVEAEARLLELVAEHCSLPVPRVLRVRAEEQAMEMERIPGVPLLAWLDAEPRRRDEPLVAELAARLGRFHREVAALPSELVEDLVPVDATSPEAYLAETRGIIDQVATELPAAAREGVRRLLAAEPPAPATRLVLCHADLGAEHVLVDPERGGINGIVDWSDAAVTDPALDLGLLLRDLGRGPFERAVPVAGDSSGGDPGLVARAWFYARIRALEDLAFGLEQGIDLYRRQALRAIGSLLPDLGVSPERPGSRGSPDVPQVGGF